MKYAVEITDTVYDLIRAEARCIAVDCQSPQNAARWLDKVWEVVDGLEQMPSRHVLAEESAFKAYEVRRVLVFRHILLFTIDEPAQKVWVIGLRHGSRRPRPVALPDSPPPDEASS